MNTKTRNARTPSGKTTSAKNSPAAGKAGAARGAARTSRGGAAPPPAASRRKFYVFVSLVGLLTGTSVLLLALAPAPLKPDSAASLFALDTPRSMDVIFDTTNPVADGHWKTIYVHHSQTVSGNAATLGARPGGLPDHFVIGNGAGCVDGEIQVGHRWATQLPAGPATPTTSVRPDCISICLVGDFNRTGPTPTQRVRLAQLVTALQSRLKIDANSVYLVQGSGTAADAGRNFPVDAFRQQLLP